MSRTIYIVCVCVQFVGAVVSRSEVSWGSTVNLPCLLFLLFGYADGSDDLHGFVWMFWLLWICALWIVKNFPLAWAIWSFGKLLLLLQELVRAQRLALITTVSANTTREVVAMAIPCSSCCFYMFLLRRYRRRAKTEASPSPAFQRISSTPATFRGRIYKVRAAQVPVNWFWHVLALLSDENPSCFWVHSASSLEFPSQILIDHESLGGVTIPNCLNLR